MIRMRLAFAAQKTILALGGNAKNTVCLLKGRTVQISTAHKNLDDPADFRDFTKIVNRFLKEKPTVVACDFHPDYPSTRFIDRLEMVKLRQVPVQHHHAHIASCMAENMLGNEPVIGIAFDGTGFGLDGTLWGAEGFICDYKGFDRVAHLKEAPLIGGERAILEPWRSGCFWLSMIYDDAFLKLKIPFAKTIKAEKWKVLKEMLAKQVNSPFVSSMGRLFDAAASIILSKGRARFEAELAMRLESCAGMSCPKEQSYGFDTYKKNGVLVFDPLPLFRAIVTDIKKGTSRQEMACKFHGAVAKMVVGICQYARTRSKLETVVLSGGVFQNNILLRLCLGLLYKERFKVLLHQKLSCSDAGISLGQAAVANFQRI